MYAARRRRVSLLSFTITAVLVAVFFLIALAAISRLAEGYPLVPPSIVQKLGGTPSHLPSGMNYSFAILDPSTDKPLVSLPQAGRVKLQLAVQNESASVIAMKFPTALQSEFVARHVHRRLGGLIALPLEVWRSSYFHNVSRRPTVLVLQPGQTKVYEAYWDIPVYVGEAPAGEYLLTARLHGIDLPSVHLEKPL